MKPYDRVEIFEDPITKTKYEGTATLLEPVGTKCGEGEYWLVRFDQDEGGEEVYRWIYPSPVEYSGAVSAAVWHGDF